MAVYCVTGKLGSGKTLAAVSRIQHYLNRNKRVATNLDITIEKLINPYAKRTQLVRLPDVPSVHDFNAIGLGYDGEYQGEESNGLIVLDECAKWLNSRDYRDANRKALVDWMIHARKKRWDIIFIIQDVNALDKQFREMFCEHVVYCRRMDRYQIPFLSPIYKLFTGKPLNGMKLHVGLVKYGETESAPVVDRWWYTGKDLYDAYDTEQGFSEFSSPSLNTVLPPYLVYGRYFSQWETFKNGLLSIGSWPFLLGGLVLGGLLYHWAQPDPYAPNSGMFSCNDAYDALIGCDIKPAELKQILANRGQPKTSEATLPSVDTSTPGKVDSDVLEGVFISGSVKYESGQFDYSFVKNGETYYPYEHGYKVYDMTECAAMAVSLEDRHKRKKLTCVDGDTI